MANETEDDLFQKYNFIMQHLTRYGGSSLYIICLFGTIMNMLTFLQRTYKRRACSLYLLIASTCDFIHINLGLLTNILQHGFHYNGRINSTIYCRINIYFVYVLTIISGTLTALASIDRYILSSKKSTRWNYSRRSVGIRCIKLTIFFWIFISIPILFFSEHFHHSLRAEQWICSTSCRRSSCIWVQVVYICLFNGLVPASTMMIFGILTQINVRQLHQRSESKSVQVRRMNEQLATMLVLQSFKLTLTSIPYSFFNLYWIITARTYKSLVHRATENLISQIVVLLFWSNYTSFYIYIYSSDIFTHQWIKAMKKILFCSRKNRERHHGY